ncbi:MAG: glycosyltransferase [Nitrospinota bacterium]
MAISICIATYKRPKLLAELLLSLSIQNTEGLFTFEIIVVDNDKEQSARETVQKGIKKYHGLKIVYDFEPKKNISLVRNKTISHAKGDFIAFIDDDETAVPDWLLSHYKTITKGDVAATLGAVRPKFQGDAPDWLVKGGFFDRPEFDEGREITEGRTGNAMIKRTHLKQIEGLFDPKFGLTGGEDSDLFNKIMQNGGKLVWSKNAVVYETVSQDRLNLQWLLLRSFRGGIGYGRSVLKGMNFFQQTAYLMYRFSLCFVALGVSILTLPLGLHRSVWWLRKMYANIGQIVAISPYQYKEYG